MVQSLIPRESHAQVIRLHLAGKKVDYTLFWLAVGYFSKYGQGSSLPKPCTEAEWGSVLKETGRDAKTESEAIA